VKKHSANDASVKTDAPSVRLGINLAGVKNYATALPFVDLGATIYFKHIYIF